jgi:hypothetical protein
MIMSMSNIPQTASAAPGTISGTVVWPQNLGDSDDISNSLVVSALIRFDTAGTVEVKSAGTAKLASKLACKNGVCSRGFSMSGLNDRLVKIPPKGVKTVATIQIAASSLLLRSDDVNFPWPLKEAKTAKLELVIAKP